MRAPTPSDQETPGRSRPVHCRYVSETDPDAKHRMVLTPAREGGLATIESQKAASVRDISTIHLIDHEDGEPVLARCALVESCLSRMWKPGGVLLPSLWHAQVGRKLKFQIPICE